MSSSVKTCENLFGQLELLIRVSRHITFHVKYCCAPTDKGGEGGSRGRGLIWLNISIQILLYTLGLGLKNK